MKKVRIIKKLLDMDELQTVLKKINGQYSFVIVQTMSDDIAPQWTAFFPGHGSFNSYGGFLKAKYKAQEEKCDMPGFHEYALVFECDIKSIMFNLSKQNYDADDSPVDDLLWPGQNDVANVLKKGLHNQAPIRPLAGLDLSGLDNTESSDERTVPQIVRQVLDGDAPSPGLEGFNFNPPQT